MTADCALSVAAWTAPDQTQSGVIMIEQDATTPFTLTHDGTTILIDGGVIDIGTAGGIYEMPWTRRGAVVHAAITGPFS